jgi:hemoglobin/transferrin/lactoferrin receptor protein
MNAHFLPKFALLLTMLWLPMLRDAAAAEIPEPIAETPIQSASDTRMINESLAWSAAIAEPPSQPDSVLQPDSVSRLPIRIKDLERPSTEARWLTQVPATPTPIAQVPLPLPLDQEPEEEITVTGTRTPRPVRQSPANVTVIDDRALQQNLVQDIQDLIRYEPGISVQNNNRYGIQDYNIRGLGGNRVLQQVDGIRLPSRFDFGGVFPLSRDYFDLQTLGTAEIIRGPASALYGSDALAGVVSYFTIDPKTLLDRIGKDSYTGLSFTFDSADTGFVETLTQANRFGSTEFLFSYTRRDALEGDAKGGNRFVDPRDVDGNNFLGKVVFRVTPDIAFKFTVESLDRTISTVYRDVNLASITQVASTQSFQEDIKLDRKRFSTELEYNPKVAENFVNFARLQFYYQDSKEQEINTEQRLTNNRLFLRNTENEFVDRAIGINAQLRSDFKTGSISHRLSYGVDLSNTKNERPRDRVQTDTVTGVQTRNIPPDVFPTKDFPDSNTKRFGIYLQDEISFGGGKFTLIPGIRYDFYDLNTKPDELFTRNGARAANFADSALTPSVSLVYQPTPQLAVVGRFAKGFRAPLYTEINSGFTNLTGRFFKYRTISNPDLEAETSNTFELGVRGAFRRTSFSVTGFYSIYDNFIEQFADAGIERLNPAPRPPDTAIVNIFQTQNIGNARIYGLELKGELRFSPNPGGFSVLTALSWIRGEDRISGDPLRSVDPFQLVAALRYRDRADRWSVDLIGTYAGEPDVERSNSAGQRFFIPDAYFVMDLVGHVKLARNLRLNLGVFNLFDKQYFRFADVRTFTQRADIDRFAQSGRSVRVGISWQF